MFGSCAFGNMPLQPFSLLIVNSRPVGLHHNLIIGPGYGQLVALRLFRTVDALCRQRDHQPVYLSFKTKLHGVKVKRNYNPYNFSGNVGVGFLQLTLHSTEKYFRAIRKAIATIQALGKIRDINTDGQRTSFSVIINNFIHEHNYKQNTPQFH